VLVFSIAPVVVRRQSFAVDVIEASVTARTNVPVSTVNATGKTAPGSIARVQLVVPVTLLVRRVIAIVNKRAPARRKPRK